MKRPKKSQIKITTFIGYRMEFQCPHCKNVFTQALDKRMLRIACSICGNPIDLTPRLTRLGTQ